MGVVMQIVQLTTFGVNYVGHPFNSGLSENAGMLRSLRYSGCFLALLVSEAVPPLNERWGWGSCKVLVVCCAVDSAGACWSSWCCFLCLRVLTVPQFHNCCTNGANSRGGPTQGCKNVALFLAQF